ncbi:MAG: DUF1015 domain-containing protein [Candidatus Diapherotrites archaeon]
MVEIAPFRGVRYNSETMGDFSKITSPPYDVISPEHQKMYYENSPYNIIRLILGKDGEDDDEGNNRYTRAKKFLDEWLNEKVLVQDEKPCVYLYEQLFQRKGVPKSRKGFIALAKLEPYSKKIVLGHERTHLAPITDRFELMNATGCNMSPIFSLYKSDKGEIDKLLEEESNKEPLIEFSDRKNVKNRLWIIDDYSKIKLITDCMANRQIFIADGHHRYETALHFQEKNGKGIADYVMMMFIDIANPGLIVMPTHRLVSNIENLDSGKFIDELKEYFCVEEKNKPELFEEMEKCRNVNCIGFHIGKRFYLLKLKDGKIMDDLMPGKPDALKKLDVSVLHSLVLQNLLGISEEDIKMQKKVSYVKSKHVAISAVGSGEAQMAFLLNPTKIDEVTSVAMANEKMPQKSTYFFPKLLTGMVINKFG